MHALPSGLSADPSRDPHKFGKWRRRALRIKDALEGDSLNGNTKQMQHFLNTTHDRLRQLAGIIPSVHHERSHQQDMLKTDTDRSIKNKDGVYVFYSSGGYNRKSTSEKLLSPARELEIAADIQAIADELWEELRISIAAPLREDDLIQRSDELWEHTNEESMHASNRRAVILPPTTDTTNKVDFSGNFSPNKDAAQYALDQLGFE